MRGTAEGGTEVGVVGAGGDRTLTHAPLASRGWRCSVLSEEAGLVDPGWCLRLVGYLPHVPTSPMPHRPLVPGLTGADRSM